jgi:hypothetical protein
MAQGYGVNVADWALVAVLFGAGYLVYKTVGQGLIKTTDAVGDVAGSVATVGKQATSLTGTTVNDVNSVANAITKPIVTALDLPNALSTTISHLINPSWVDPNNLGYTPPPAIVNGENTIAGNATPNVAPVPGALLTWADMNADWNAQNGGG